MAWKNPQLVFDAFKISNLYGIFGPMMRVDFDTETSIGEIRAEYGYVVNLCQHLQSMYNRLQSYSPEVAGQLFSDTLKCEILKLTEMITRSQKYQLVTRLRWSFVQLAESIRGQSASIDHQLVTTAIIVFESISNMITILVGDEGHVLVGAYENKPAWKTLSNPVASPNEVMSLPVVNPALFAITSQEDVDMIPERKHSNWRPPHNLPKINDLRPSLELLEDAFANMRFVPDQNGSNVLIQGYPRLKSIFLKVKQLDERMMGFWARIEHDQGFMVFGLPDVAAALKSSESESTYFAFIVFLCCQVYHDLVTAREIKVASGKKRPKIPETKKVKKNRVIDYHPRYIYIPRVVHNVEEPVRTALSKPLQDYTPRHVVGHYRRANMSEEQRANVVEFELKTGLQVLSYIKPGYTFVRPHISPKMADEEWMRLPTYIKARIQDDIARYFGSVHPEENGSDEETN